MCTTAIVTVTWFIANVHCLDNTGQETKFAAKKEIQDEEHLKQHLHDKIDVENMTEEQKRFHYFSIHDLNRDTKLDGLEVIKSMYHYHEKEEKNAPKPMTDEAIETIIDDVLKHFDKNLDGYIEYNEYVAVMTKEELSLAISFGGMRAAAVVTITWLISANVHCVGSTYFARNEEIHDEGHIKQHLQDKIEIEKMTEEQKRFHYFSMNDLDHDNRIDGTEILKALTHTHEGDTGLGTPVQNEDDMISMIDAVLADMDLNGDGYVDYAEYLKRTGT
ncbi:unnamed protein product [Cylicocyclus nassatus]|uniref:EF-hand domain-containing protein n=1 Tax=Cylicocyclus nassatus TaxID=53992 RepID=A0AA36DN99_CYLNA|nr:unnamed protein product [Cylicocyclus nassatus]